MTPFPFQINILSNERGTIAHLSTYADTLELALEMVAYYIQEGRALQVEVTDSSSGTCCWQAQAAAYSPESKRGCVQGS
jgi:hypothetical protein